MMSRSRTPKRVKIRSFEREERIRQLVTAGFIATPAEIPADAIPAAPDFVRQCRGSLRMYRRAPYYRDIEFVCTDCGAPDVWTAQEQRHWFEQLRGTIYSDAKRCRLCRRRRRGAPEKTNRKKS